MVTYFLFVNLYAALFFGLYIVFLKNRNAYQWSRFYLLVASVLALILPLVKISSFQQVILLNPDGAIRNGMPEIILYSGKGAVESANGDVLAGVYFAICFLLFLRLLIPFARLSLLVKKLKREQGSSGILTHTGIGPGSFGTTILFPGEETDLCILAHERAHIRNKHYLDKIYFHLLLCLCFPVIAFYAMRKELEIIQEFQADAAAATDPESYSRILLQQYFPSGWHTLIQSFFKHPIKRRIMMLSKTPRPARRILLLFAATLTISALLLVQNIDPVFAQQKSLPETVFRSVDQMPEFPGGTEALFQYFSSNIIYPESAKKDSIQGRVFVQFVVAADGKVKDASVLKGLTADCDAEIIRVVKNMPEWKPGEQGGKKVAVYYTLPVTFAFNRPDNQRSFK